MITIYYEDGTSQVIRPSVAHFEHSGTAVKELVTTVAQGRPVRYYVDGFKQNKVR